MADTSTVCSFHDKLSIWLKIVWVKTKIISAQNLTILRKCGIPEWVLVDEDWKDFIGFYKDNITNTNILTDEELVE